MKHSRAFHCNKSYLDVTEFILKEHSPLYRPTQPQNHFIDEEQFQNKTPEIQPIEDSCSWKMTPLCQGLLNPLHSVEFMEQLILCEDDNFDRDSAPFKKYQSKRARRHKFRKRQNSMHFLNFENDLERIIEESQNDNPEYNQQSSFYQDFESESEQEECYLTRTSKFGKDIQDEKQSTVDLCLTQITETIQRYNKNTKSEIIAQIALIQNSSAQSDKQKLQLIKQKIKKYLLDHEAYCYEEAWKQLQNYSLSETILKIKEGLEETFTKKVANLPFQHRRIKLLKYLEKKKKRIWKKKVSYDCRKKVADGRLRIKGKFVTRQQACYQLGVSNLEGFQSQEIKNLLEKKLQENQDSASIKSE